MAHYAVIDNNKKVVEVFVGKEEGDTNWESHYTEMKGMICVRTSYNTRGGVHMLGGVPFRKNYAGVGYYYDTERDAFIPPKPFESWLLDEATCLWQPPIEYPDDGKIYEWDESTTQWLDLTPPKI